jgi:glycogen debranching enzyme
LKDQAQCNELVLDLANDMARTLGYIEDVKQFARLAQLKQAIRDVTPLIEDTTDFIVEFTHGGGS